jgi:hypothetical protein
MPPLANPYKTSTINYDGLKKLFGGHVRTGMSMNDILCVMDQVVEALFVQIGYDCVDLEKLGIKCPDKDADKKCLILNWLIDHLLQAEQDITNIYQIITLIQNTIGLLKDEKVKVRAAGVANYLENIIIAPASAMDVQNDTITFMGFLPIGFQGTINPNRIGDFDATGKGKPNTDLWGLAIRNGNNGTQNVFGLFCMYTDDILNVGTIAGDADFLVDKVNIKSFTLPVTGIILDALDNNVTFKFDATNNLNGGPRPNGFASNHSGSVSEYQTKPANFKHGHGFNLSVTHTNPNATPIPLIPRHIKELPVERIIP